MKSRVVSSDIEISLSYSISHYIVITSLSLSLSYVDVASFFKAQPHTLGFCEIYVKYSQRSILMDRSDTYCTEIYISYTTQTLKELSICNVYRYDSLKLTVSCILPLYQRLCSVTTRYSVCHRKQQMAECLALNAHF